MNNLGKVLVVSTGGLVALCLCLGAVALIALQGTGRILASTVDADPLTVASAGDEIAAYTVPAGFDGGSAVDLAGFTMVNYTGHDGHSHIYLIQKPEWLNLDQADLESQMAQAAGTDRWTEVSVVDSQPCQIRGQESTLVISEGISHDNRRYRTANALFQGNGGLALLSISAPASSWDQEMVDAFIESIQ